MIKRIAWNRQNIFNKCIVCEKDFKTNKSKIKNGNKFCSQKCYWESKKGKIPWNKGKALGFIPKGCFKKGNIPWCKGTKGKVKAWNKGKSLGFTPKMAFKKGMTPWNKGKNIKYCGGGFKKGNIAWNKGRHPDYMQGKNHHAWKGGITPIHRAIRASVEYEEWRKKVFERDNYTCVKCGKIGDYLNADHIKRFAEYHELRFDINNGQTLCEDCHKIKTIIEGKLYWKNQFKKSNYVI